MGPGRHYTPSGCPWHSLGTVLDLFWAPAALTGALSVPSGACCGALGRSSLYVVKCPKCGFRSVGHSQGAAMLLLGGLLRSRGLLWGSLGCARQGCPLALSGRARGVFPSFLEMSRCRPCMLSIPGGCNSPQKSKKSKQIHGSAWISWISEAAKHR